MEAYLKPPIHPTTHLLNLSRSETRGGHLVCLRSLEIPALYEIAIPPSIGAPERPMCPLLRVLHLLAISDRGTPEDLQASSVSLYLRETHETVKHLPTGVLEPRIPHLTMSVYVARM
jgi:hypothetical protein